MTLKDELEKMDRRAACNYLVETGKAKNAADALRVLDKAIPLEKAYQARVMKYLKETYPSGFVWKAAAGAYTRGGIPDVCAIIDGKFWAFEIKRPFFGKLSPLQEQAINKINKAGGHAAVVSTPADVAKIMEG